MIQQHNLQTVQDVAELVGGEDVGIGQCSRCIGVIVRQHHTGTAQTNGTGSDPMGIQKHLLRGAIADDFAANQLEGLIQAEQDDLFRDDAGEPRFQIVAEFRQRVHDITVAHFIQLVHLAELRNQLQQHRRIFSDAVNALQVLDVRIQHAGKRVKLCHEIVGDGVGVHPWKRIEQQQFQYLVGLKGLQSAVLKSLSHAFPMSAVAVGGMCGSVSIVLFLTHSAFTSIKTAFLFSENMVY